MGRWVWHGVPLCSPSALWLLVSREFGHAYALLREGQKPLMNLPVPCTGVHLASRASRRRDAGLLAHDHDDTDAGHKKQWELAERGCPAARLCEHLGFRVCGWKVQRVLDGKDAVTAHVA